MKRVFALLLVCILCLSLWGCGVDREKEIQQALENKNWMEAKAILIQIKDSPQKENLLTQYELGIFSEISYLLNQKKFDEAVKLADELSIAGTAKKVTILVLANYFFRECRTVLREEDSLVTTMNMQLTVTQISGDVSYFTDTLPEKVSEIKKKLDTCKEQLPSSLLPEDVQQLYKEYFSIMEKFTDLLERFSLALKRKETDDVQKMGTEFEELGEEMENSTLDAELNKCERAYEASKIPSEYLKYIEIL